MLTSTSQPSPSDNATTCKRKRRPAGTPDPDAEVVSLSPRTLLESDRYVCDICNQGFQRDQNLQMHRRRHKVPWKLLKRETPEVRKRVFVCPEPSCLHHDPCHALGDLVGIKKHYRRKHSNQKQWVCAKCCKGYAVQSDYKAHLKTCGTRGHSCDCGRVFSRVESFIEHQDACATSRALTDHNHPQISPTACLSRSVSSPSSDTNFSSPAPIWPDLRIFPQNSITPSLFFHPHSQSTRSPSTTLQLLPTSPGTRYNDFPNSSSSSTLPTSDEAEADATKLVLSLGPSNIDDEPSTMRKLATRQMAVAENELASTKWLRKQAEAEITNALVTRDHTLARFRTVMDEVTCDVSCKVMMKKKKKEEEEASFVSSVVTDQGT